MSEKTKLIILLSLLVVSISLAVLINSSASQILVAS